MNSNHERKPHSAEYFGEYRDFWWNTDFLGLMGQRLQFSQINEILDVGCGIGHWGQLLAPLFPKKARLTGVDREEAWIVKAKERAQAFGLSDRSTYLKGDVNKLPFDDNSFDLVTCQTLLIHLKDPKIGLQEMLRVLKPGGMLLAAEPNNLTNRSIGSSLTAKLSVDEVMERLRFGLMVERGKEAMGLGFNSVGDLIPGYMAELGATNVRVYMSDKAGPWLPPYSSKEEKVNIQQARDWCKRKFIGWDRQEVLAYFVAGGGREDEFNRTWNVLLEDAEDMIKAIDEGSYHSAGGAVTYLIAGTKPTS